jgi:hypothetical protein
MTVSPAAAGTRFSANIANTSSAPEVNVRKAVHAVKGNVAMNRAARRDRRAPRPSRRHISAY